MLSSNGKVRCRAITTYYVLANDALTCTMATVCRALVHALSIASKYTHSDFSWPPMKKKIVFGNSIQDTSNK